MILPKPNAEHITGLTEADALQRLFALYQKQRVEGEGPQSFQAWLEQESPKLWIKLEAWDVLFKGTLERMRLEIKHCNQILDEQHYSSQTLPGIIRTKEQANAVLTQLLRIGGIIQHLKIE